MKPDCSIRLSPVIVGGLLLLLSASVSSAASDGTTAPPPAAANTTAAHTMFMGLDLAVPHAGANLAVLDVNDFGVVVAVDGKPVRVPTAERNIRLQIKHSLKLSDGAATIAKLSAEPGFSPDKDPHRRFASAAGGAGGVGAMVDLASVGVRESEMAFAATTGVINSGVSAPGAIDGQAAAAAHMEAVTSGIAAASQSGFSDQFQVGTYAQKLTEELAEGNYDALDVTFDVSSPEPLTAPWIAVLVKYRERERPQEEARTWIVTKALAPIGPESTTVRFKQTGMPLGFRIESYQVHLYNRGEEIATTESPMRTILTPEEAFQYRVVDYVGSHPEATLPAAPAAGQLTEPLRTRLSTQYLNQPVYVKVLPTGRSDGAYSDKACKQSINDAELESMLSLVRFNPALDKGKPVRGVVMLVGKPS